MGCCGVSVRCEEGEGASGKVDAGRRSVSGSGREVCISNQKRAGSALSPHEDTGALSSYTPVQRT